MQTDKRFMTTGEAAKVLGVSAEWVQHLFDRGSLSGFRVGPNRIIRRSSVEKHMENKREKATA